MVEVVVIRDVILIVAVVWPKSGMTPSTPGGDRGPRGTASSDWKSGLSAVGRGLIVEIRTLEVCG
jgi:hypothetical protein